MKSIIDSDGFSLATADDFTPDADGNILHQNKLYLGCKVVDGQGFLYKNGVWLDGPPPDITEEQYLFAVDQTLQEGAQRKRYDSIHTAALRAGYPGPFHDEGVAYASWMDSVYSMCYQVMAEVKSGHRKKPTVGELLALLPPCPFAADTPGS